MHLSKAMVLAAASSAIVGTGIFMGNSTRSAPPNAKLNNAASHVRLFGAGRIAFSDSAKTRASSSPSVKEVSTNLEFPKIYKLPGASKDLTLLGLGVREKKLAFISVKVYAVGFYADHEKLESDPLLKNNIGQGKFEKGLQIVLARDIDGALFSSALDEELKPRMKSDQQTLVEFGNLFKDLSLKKGTRICFTWIQPSTLHVGLPDRAIFSSFSSETLAKALFDVYLGDDKPVSPSLKASILDGLREEI